MLGRTVRRPAWKAAEGGVGSDENDVAELSFEHLREHRLRPSNRTQVVHVHHRFVVSEWAIDDVRNHAESCAVHERVNAAKSSLDSARCRVHRSEIARIRHHGDKFPCPATKALRDIVECPLNATDQSGARTRSHGHPRHRLADPTGRPDDCHYPIEREV